MPNKIPQTTLNTDQAINPIIALCVMLATTEYMTKPAANPIMNKNLIIKIRNLVW